MADVFAPRLHVLLASAAPVGVVFRRGPSKQVASILWDRRTDEFTIGQWLKGRIYERRSDLSPDGRYLIYFAMNGQWNGEALGSWTAVSRAPYLKALALYPKGDCWHGGGLFTGRRRYWINWGYGHHVLRTTDEPQRDERWRPAESFGGEDQGVYYPRLLRDGWALVERRSLAKWKDVDLFDKAIPHGWVLRKLAHGQVPSLPGKGCYWDEHEMIHRESGRALARPDWEWADWADGRLVWACGGKLFAAELHQDGPGAARELFDFNPMTFEAIAAPY